MRLSNAFWARLAASAVMVNIPVAWAVLDGTSPVVAAAYAVSAGVVSLLLWRPLELQAAAAGRSSEAVAVTVDALLAETTDGAPPQLSLRRSARAVSRASRRAGLRVLPKAS